MQLYLASIGPNVAGERQLAQALLTVAGPFRQLDSDTQLTCSSKTGAVKLAVLAHSPRKAAPRRYLARGEGRVVAYDGLPVDPAGAFPAWDARALLEHWAAAQSRLEGQFSVLMADMESDRLECLTDTLGISPVYAQRLPRGWLVGNSVEAIRLVSGASELDPLGVSSLLTLGWVGGHRTLLAPIEALQGGATHIFTADSRRARMRFSPGEAIRQARVTGTDAVATGDLVAELVGMTVGATSGPEIPVVCAVTAGRDTRVLLALAMAAGVTPRTTTSGFEQDADVQVGRAVAAAAGLDHKRADPDAGAAFEDAADASRTFVSVTDGLCSLIQLQDIGDLADPLERVGVQLWGVGGEIARSGTTPLRGFSANAPLLSRSSKIQLRLLQTKLSAFDGVVRPAAISQTSSHLERFVHRRLEEGWRAAELSEAFFTWERVGPWGSSGIRRASAIDDLFSPFCSQAYIRYAFALSSGERFCEAAHWRVLSALDPRLRDLAYETPWRAQRPALASLSAMRDAVQMVRRRVGARQRVRPTPAAGSAHTPPPFAFQWLERHRALHRDMSLSQTSSPLWDWISRRELERAFAQPTFSESMAEGLLRVLTLFWYFHR